MFDGPPQSEVKIVGSLAIIEIRGPMVHHDDWWWESYDAITRLAAQAYASEAKAVLFSADTPGGEVSGLFDTARQLRRFADQSGKLFGWYVDGQCCSAGMGLAVGADVVIIPDEARAGSIGVIAEAWNAIEAAEKWGHKCRIFTSGKRKADGHPMAEMTEDMAKAIQASVDYEANIFFEWVAEQRELSAAEVQGWQAAIFHGAEALEVGLADVIGGFSDALSILENAVSGEAPAGANNNGADMKVPKSHAGAHAIAASLSAGTPAVSTRADSDDMKKLRDSLGKKAAEDSDEGRKARKALDALDADDAEGEEDDDKNKNDDDDGGDENEGEDDGGEESASAAEDDGDADEAKLAEDESAKAKKAEDESNEEDAKAAKAEDEVDEALSRGDSKAALAARKRAKASRARAANARNRASVHRTAARVHASLARPRAAAPVRTNKPAAPKAGEASNRVAEALAATRAPTTRGATQTGSSDPDGNVITLDGVFPEDLATLGVSKRAANGAVRSDVDGLTIPQGMSPEDAKAIMAKLDSEAARAAARVSQ